MTTPSLVENIYATVLGEQAWTPVLEGIRTLTGARIVNLVTLDSHGATQALDSASDDAAWAEELRQRYNADFHPYDPTAGIVVQWEAGRWYDHREWSTPTQRAHSLFHQEFLRPRDAGNWEGMFLHRTPQSSHFLSLSSGWRDQDETTSYRAALAGVQTHLQRALRLQARVDTLQQRAESADAALDALAAPVFLLDAQRVLLHANGAAVALMAREPALRFAQGRFMPPGIADAQAWQAACDRGALVVVRPTHATWPLVLTLVPVPAWTRIAGATQQPMTLMLGPGAASPEAARHRLGLIFALTPAEADVCLRLCGEGLTPQACAEVRGVSIGTIRSQIKIIFLKTGVTRMLDLQRLVASIQG